MGVLQFKAGVTLRPHPAGARLLGAIERVTRAWPSDVTITAGSDSHPPTDPHTLGKAFDVRTHGMVDGEKQRFLALVLQDLAEDAADTLRTQTIADIWYARNTKLWFGQVEDHNGPSEHIHLQLRNAAVFPPTSPATPVAPPTLNA